MSKTLVATVEIYIETTDDVDPNKVLIGMQPQEIVVLRRGSGLPTRVQAKIIGHTTVDCVVQTKGLP